MVCFSCIYVISPAGGRMCSILDGGHFVALCSINVLQGTEKKKFTLTVTITVDTVTSGSWNVNNHSMQPGTL